MPNTTKSDVIIKDVFDDTVRGAFASSRAFIGSLAVQLGIVKINDTFDVSDPNMIGKNVNIPYFGSVGVMVDNADGSTVTPQKLGQSQEQAVVQRGSIALELTRWADKGAVGTDVYDEWAQQAVESAELYMDRVIMKAAVSGNQQLIHSVYDAATPRNFSDLVLIDALKRWGDRGGLERVAGVAVHSDTMVDLLKMRDANGNTNSILDVSGPYPKLLGRPIIVSDAIQPDITMASVTPTATGTTPPTITFTDTANREDGTGPVRPIDLWIKCTLLGALGVWKLQYSIDGGQTYSADVLSAATVALTDPLDPAGGLLGLTLNIAAGNAAVNNLWKAKSVATHNSLLLKKGSLAFWYNKGALELLQALKPYGDYTENALHLYCCAHRYVRLPNEPRSGVVKVRHNANGL